VQSPALLDSAGSGSAFSGQGCTCCWWRQSKRPVLLGPWLASTVTPVLAYCVTIKPLCCLRHATVMFGASQAADAEASTAAAGGLSRSIAWGGGSFIAGHSAFIRHGTYSSVARSPASSRISLDATQPGVNMPSTVATQQQSAHLRILHWLQLSFGAAPPCTLSKQNCHF